MAWFSQISKLRPVKGFQFSRPIVLFHSDDWGLIGIRDLVGFRKLKDGGLELGDQPYDFYSLETAEDLYRLYEVLLRHRDSIGRPPCFVFNFIVSNVNFPKVTDSGFRSLELMSLDEGFPGRWQRSGLLEAYREGIQCGLIYPAFHGLTHFCLRVAERTLNDQGDRGGLLRKIYAADTPFIPERMRWISFEYRDDSGDEGSGWLDLATQQKLIQEGVGLFERIFGFFPTSACAPGYRMNQDTRRGWALMGIRVAHYGPALQMAPHFDESGLLMVHRNVPFEPALEEDHTNLLRVLNQANECFRAGRPITVCMHSVNFHSTIKNNRDQTLQHLDHFLGMLERKYEDLLYVHDDDLWQMVKTSSMEWNGHQIPIRVKKVLQPSPSLQYQLWKMSGKTTIAT